MAPATAAEVEQLCEYFQSAGLSATRSLEVAKNPKTAAAAHSLFSRNGIETKALSDKQGMMLLQVAKDGAKLKEEDRDYIVEAVVDGRLKSADQVTAALKYLATNPTPVDKAAFDTACGVGFSATLDEILTRVRAYVQAHKADLAKAGWVGIGKTQGAFKLDEGLRWAPPLDVKAATEQVFTEEFGPKVAPTKAAKVALTAKATDPAAASAAAASEAPDEVFATGWISKLHKPGGNEQKIPERMKEHLEWTGGKVFTRFPPEPNGFLHIGHSKAIAINFGYAKYNHGHCYLRFDDTNPEAEEQIYFDKILEAVRWLGYEPYKITYSSDNFQKLYDLAVDLIKRDLAYTSNDTAEDISNQRGGKEHGPRHESKDRNKPIEQSLKEFAAMRAGEYQPGEMTLRMKQDMTNPNPVMWDIIAYRVLKKPHHRTGTTWCIYPTYDFTHCLCDSFENISHSLCSSEFITAREAYEWLCDALEVYKPRQSEYGRMSLEGTVTSKRKLLRLVTEGHVSGWDDPRLYTLVALKRRGVPPAAVIAFVSGLGITPSPGTIQLARFESVVRAQLETSTPRLMMILRPIKVTIENLASDFAIFVDKPMHPKDATMGTNSVPFTNTIYIDQDDFHLVPPEKDYKRLAPGGKAVGLLNVPYSITYVSHETAPDGTVLSIVCRAEDAKALPKGSGWIQWVAEHAPSHSPVRVAETRIFKRLFRSDNPGALDKDEYIKDIDPDSLVRVQGALLEVGIWKVIDSSLADARKVVAERSKAAKKDGVEAPPQVDGLEVVRFQGLRVAYFALDLDTVLVEGAKEGEERTDKLVLNLIAPLKEDSTKKKVEGKK